MDSIEDRRREERFVNAWKRWSQQPPQRAPAEAAANVAGRLSKRPRSQPWWLLAAAVIVLAVALVVHWTAVSRRTPDPEAGNSAHEISPLGEGEVLIWLDDETPLYMTFQPPEETAGPRDKS